MTTRTAWTAAAQTREGKIVTVRVWAAGRTRAGLLAMWAVEREFGSFRRVVSPFSYNHLSRPSNREGCISVVPGTRRTI